LESVGQSTGLGKNYKKYWMGDEKDVFVLALRIECEALINFIHPLSSILKSYGWLNAPSSVRPVWIHSSKRVAR